MSKTVGKSYNTSDAVLQYTIAHSIRMTKVQEKLMQETLKHRSAGMMGAPEVVQLNTNLMQAIGAKQVLDIGVFTGVSALAAALAIPAEGKVFALDINDQFVSIGKPFWEEAGVTNKIKLHLGPALDTLHKLLSDGHEGQFDFAFIDADKINYDDYYELSLQLLRPGGIIAVDNTLWSGTVVEQDDQSESTVAIRKFNTNRKLDQRINISFLNIGDGLTLCFKK